MTDTDTKTMPTGWKMTTLDQVAEIHGGKRLPLGTSLQAEKNSHPYIRITDITDNSVQKNALLYVPDSVFPSIKRYIVNEGDIILSIVGTIGSVSKIYKELDNASLTENCVKLTKLQGIENNFLFYYLTSREGQEEIKSKNVGSTQPKLPIYNIEKLEILLPLLPEQRAISAVLSSLDDKIELLREENKTLEATAQAIFKEWFINFNFPGAIGKMIDSELGKIPEGWRVGKLGDEVKILMGQSPSGESFNENGDGTVFFQGRTDFTVRFPQTRLYTTEPKRMAKKFDVLVSVRAPVGDINVASENCCIGRGLAAISSEHKTYALYKIKSLQDSFEKFESEGTVFGSINKDSFNNIEVLIPNIDVVKNFEEVVNPFDEKIFNNYSQIQNITELRDALLSILMKGEIRVK